MTTRTYNPATHVAVPIEPTMAMPEAGNHESDDDCATYESVYRAMIAAAPQPQEQSEPVAWTRPDATNSFISHSEKLANEFQAAQFYTIPLYAAPPDLAAILESRNALVRQIDEIISGKDGMAKQASLCDLVGPIRDLAAKVAELEKQRDDLNRLCEFNERTMADLNSRWKNVKAERLMTSALDESRIKELESTISEQAEIIRMARIAIDEHLNPCGCLSGCEFCNGKVSLEEALAKLVSTPDNSRITELESTIAAQAEQIKQMEIEADPEALSISYLQGKSSASETIRKQAEQIRVALDCLNNSTVSCINSPFVTIARWRVQEALAKIGGA